jgi:hypothetical protein
VAEDPAPVAFDFVAADAGSRAGLVPLPPFTLYENPTALPRAFRVPEARPLPERSRLRATLAGTDFRQTAWLEGLPAPRRHADPAFRPIAITSYRPNRIEMDLAGGPGGVLVLADPWFPGWTAAVDGQPAPVYPANYLFRAVEVPDGARQVVWEFRPRGFRIAAAVSLAVLALVLLASLAHFFRAPAK